MEKVRGMKMEKTIGIYLEKLAGKISEIFGNTIEDQGSKDDQELVRCVQMAMDEWCQAEKFFESVSEPELVDYAIYRIEASKKRYMYLLKQAKEKGIKVDCC